jgi:hypothetical protein
MMLVKIVYTCLTLKPYVPQELECVLYVCMHVFEEQPWSHLIQTKCYVRIFEFG